MRSTSLLLVLTALVTLYFDFPGDLQGHSHWGKVSWQPFGGPFLPRDTLLNVLLFVPFGIVARLRFPRRRTVCLLLGLGLALAGEGTQVFSHGRVPSMTDVTSNMIGTSAGIVAARMVGF